LRKTDRLVRTLSETELGFIDESALGIVDVYQLFQILADI
jgi:hypothetical protein